VIDERPKAAPWSRAVERLGVALWTSFLAACLETAAFFAFIDPWVLGSAATIPPWFSYRPAAYGSGFFFFWLCTFIGSALTAYMLDTSRHASAHTERRP
jgi:hypothetical protein